MLKLVRITMVMMKWLKNHFFSRSRTDLQGILPLYVPEKDEFPLIVLAMVEAFS